MILRAGVLRQRLDGLRSRFERTAGSPSLTPRDLPPADDSTPTVAIPADDLSPAARFQHPMVSDEETLLGSAAVTAPLGEGSPRAAAPAAPAASSYALIAHPFARFSDLGQFQAAVQALPSVHNVRVRRFAQGTLEMRVDYDGSAPLTDVLPEHSLRTAARLTHWICENAKSCRAYLKRVDALHPLAAPLQQQHIAELPREAHKKGDHGDKNHHRHEIA